MPIEVPESSFADVEGVACDLLDSYLVEIKGDEVRSVTYLNEGFEEALNDGGTVVLVSRLGGSADYADGAVVDPALINVAVLSDKRSNSTKVLNYLRHCLFKDRDGVDVGKWRVVKIGEAMGPVEDPFLDPDRRMVNLTFEISVRRRRV